VKWILLYQDVALDESYEHGDDPLGSIEGRQFIDN
jgi:hypothetical protein